MKLLVLALLGLIGWAWFSGYRVHPENLPYYLKVDVSSSKQVIDFVNGTSVTATVEKDTADSIKLNMDGILSTFKKSQIKSMKSVAAPDFLTLMKKNYEAHHLLHPLWTRRNEDTMVAKFEHFATSPERLAEEIKKNNPGLSATEESEKVMAAAGRARLAAYKENKKLTDAAAAEAENKSTDYFK